MFTNSYYVSVWLYKIEAIMFIMRAHYFRGDLTIVDTNERQNACTNTTIQKVCILLLPDIDISPIIVDNYCHIISISGDQH